MPLCLDHSAAYLRVQKSAMFFALCAVVLTDVDRWEDLSELRTHGLLASARCRSDGAGLEKDEVSHQWRVTVKLQRPSTERSRHTIHSPGFPSILPLANFRVTRTPLWC